MCTRHNIKMNRLSHGKGGGNRRLVVWEEKMLLCTSCFVNKPSQCLPYNPYRYLLQNRQFKYDTKFKLRALDMSRETIEVMSRYDWENGAFYYCTGRRGGVHAFTME